MYSSLILCVKRKILCIQIAYEGITLLYIELVYIICSGFRNQWWFAYQDYESVKSKKNRQTGRKEEVSIHRGNVMCIILACLLFLFVAACSLPAYYTTTTSKSTDENIIMINIIFITTATSNGFSLFSLSSFQLFAFVTIMNKVSNSSETIKLSQVLIFP